VRALSRVVVVGAPLGGGYAVVDSEGCVVLGSHKGRRVVGGQRSPHCCTAL
jgi:hypothetical protein